MNTATASASGAGSSILFFLILIVAALAYFAPTIVASRRNVPNIGSVAVINILLGWTVIAWIVALAMALRDVPADRARPVRPVPPTPPYAGPRHR